MNRNTNAGTISYSFIVFKGGTSRFAHLEKFILDFSLFVIRVNLLHP